MENSWQISMCKVFTSSTNQTWDCMLLCHLNLLIVSSLHWQPRQCDDFGLLHAIGPSVRQRFSFYAFQSFNILSLNSSLHSSCVTKIFLSSLKSRTLVTAILELHKIPHFSQTPLIYFLSKYLSAYNIPGIGNTARLYKLHSLVIWQGIIEIIIYWDCSIIWVSYQTVNFERTKILYHHLQSQYCHGCLNQIQIIPTWSGPSHIRALALEL